MVSSEQSSSSSMAPHLARGGAGLSRVRPSRGRGSGAFAGHHGRFVGRRSAGDFLDRSRDPAQRRAEIGQINHGKKQSDHPEEMVVGKEGKKAHNRPDL